MTGRAWFLLLLAAAGAAALALSLPRLEGTPPRVDAPESLVLGRDARPLALEIEDAGTGLRSASLRLEHEGGEHVLAAERFRGDAWAGGEARGRLEVELDAAALGLADGEARLVVEARDRAWRDFLAGNRAEVVIPLRVDTQPPRVSVETGLTWVRRGGAGAVVYRVDETPAEDGVQVGDAFFPGVALAEGEPGRRVALYAIPVDAPADPALRVVARDEAGNETRAAWPARVVERRFPDEAIRLSTSFLETVAVPLARAHGLETDDPVEAFRRVNEDLRERSEERIREVLAEPTRERRFEGAFEQLANSAVTSGFAEHRMYRVEGRTVSEARHLGFDLASTQAAPVTAGAAGTVRHAGDLGIYGNTVVLDHGMGLASLYAHLSRVDVSVGDEVGSGEVVGLSGATGLAGGDHLHFAVLVGGVYVDPLEWWDARWVREHIVAVLEPPTASASR